MRRHKQPRWAFIFSYSEPKPKRPYATYSPEANVIEINLDLVSNFARLYTHGSYEGRLVKYLSYLFSHEYIHAVLVQVVGESTSFMLDNLSPHGHSSDEKLHGR